MFQVLPTLSAEDEPYSFDIGREDRLGPPNIGWDVEDRFGPPYFENVLLSPAKEAPPSRGFLGVFMFVLLNNL